MLKKSGEELTGMFRRASNEDMIIKSTMKANSKSGKVVFTAVINRVFSVLMPAGPLTSRTFCSRESRLDFEKMLEAGNATILRQSINIHHRDIIRMADATKWRMSGDWFDVCKCNVPCPCEFAQTPTYGDCEGVLAWHIRKGHYGSVPLDGLNVLGLGSFRGNLWAGETKVTMGLFIDERADKGQREALQTVFGGRAGGHPAEFAKLIGEMRGIEFAPIRFEISRNLAYWGAEIPGKVAAKAEALSGPTTPKGKRVQTLNPPGSEVGPGGVVTWATATTDRVNALGFKWDWAGRSSKHIPFNWKGP